MSLRAALLAGSLGACATAPAEGPGDGATIDERACRAIRSLAEPCGPLLDQPVYVTLVDRTAGQANDVALLGAITGETCRLASFPASEAIDQVSSLAVIGTDVFFCAATSVDGAGLLTRVALVDGRVTTSGLRCLSTTALSDRLLVMTEVGSTLQEYASFEAVLAGTASALTVGPWAIRMGAGDEKLYATTPAAGTLYVFDPATEASAQLEIPPSTSTIGVMGIAEQRGTLAVLDGASFNQYLHTFDAAMATPKERVIASSQVARLHGLANACRDAVLQ